MLRGITALVTGGTRGIGRACATRLALDGAHVVVASRSIDNAKSVAAELSSELAPVDTAGCPQKLTSDYNLQHFGVGCDVRDADAVTEMFCSIAKDSPRPLGIVVNAAGVNIDGLLMRSSVASIDVRIAFFLTI